MEKQEIWNAIYNKNVPLAKKRDLLLEYKNSCSKDIDIYELEMDLLCQENKLQEACDIAKTALKINPYLIEIHFRLAKLYEIQSEYLEAYKYYCITRFLADYANEAELIPICEKSMQEVIGCLEKTIALLPEEQKQLLMHKEIPDMLACEDNKFGYKEYRFRSSSNMVGNYYYENENIKKYVGMYHVPLIIREVKGAMNAIFSKVEFRNVTETSCFELSPFSEEWIVPVAVEKENTVHVIYNLNGQKTYLQRYQKSFYYYRLSGGSKIMSSGKCYYGEPIPIKSDKIKKKLVLSIFVDGLAQVMLNNGKFEKLMPNTAKYFKEGFICTQTYSSGEWTYPSIAGAVSGLTTVQHMMFHNEIDWKLPDDVKTLMEYFHEAGYYTTAFSGDWRIIPSYGYARGCDRFIYQHQHTGFSVEKMVGNVISEIEALKEINQYVWMTIGDLHNVADECELPTCVQTNLEIEDREFKQKGITSVKQSYDSAKQHQYEGMMSYVDRYLGMLFQYLKDTYKDEEILISLFADHGQGYLIPDGGQFLGPERSNVAFMFKDGEHIGKTSEIMSLLDYPAIMCKLAGIDYNSNKVSGRLPKIFGGKGRKWALTESLHPNDYYRAALVNENYRFYFCNVDKVRYDGRFKLVGYMVSLADKNGKKISMPPEIERECTDIILGHIAHLLIC